MTPRRPLIRRVTTQTLQSIDGIPAELPLSWVMNQRYARAVITAGGAPVLVPLLDDEPESLRAIYDRLDGILIPGGVDMGPDTYGAVPHEKLGRLDVPRDGTELLLTRWAVEEKKPFLGLCRGIQVLSVALGGTLWQDLTTERPSTIKHDWFPAAGISREKISHPVDILPSTRLGAAMGVGETPVNSMHHQGIRDLGKGLVPSAIAPDGLVEGVELPGDQFAVAVQWHPEVFPPGAPSVGQLFGAFVRPPRKVDKETPMEPWVVRGPVGGTHA